MTAKMDLLVAASTGHVLAAALRGDASGPAPDAAALVGDALHIRDEKTGETLLALAPAHLAVQSVDLRDDVLLTARRFVLVDGLPELGKTPAANPLQLDGAKVKVKMSTPAPEGGATVWVYIEGGPQPVVQRVLVAKGDDSAEEPLALPSGDYRALVLSPGDQAVVIKQTVP